MELTKEDKQIIIQALESISVRIVDAPRILEIIKKLKMEEKK